MSNVLEQPAPTVPIGNCITVDVEVFEPNPFNGRHFVPNPRTHALEYTPDNITVIKKNQTHCARGHELSGENLYIYPGTTKRRCRRVCF